MTRVRFVTALVSGIIASSAGAAFAQTTPPLTATRTREIAKAATATAADRCDFYLSTEPRRLGYTDANGNSEIANCATDLRKALEQIAADEANKIPNADLIKTRVGFKALKKWVCEGKPSFVPKGTTTTGECASPVEGANIAPWINARKVLDEIEILLPEVLKSRQLFAQFAAVLVTGFSFTDANQPEPATPAAAPATTDAKKDATAVGTIVWQTRHFGDESLAPVDIQLGGRVGVSPILNLVAPLETPAPGAAPTSGVTAVHQTAFVWNFAVQMNRHLRGINSEWGVFGKTGSSTLMSLPKAVDRGDASFLAFPIDKGISQTAWLWEGGVEFNMYDTRLEQIHAEKGHLSPQFQLVVALRKDERFRAGVYDAYDNPAARLVVRLTLDAIKVVDRRQFGEPGKPFTFGFVVEHERSLATKGIRVPSATRFILRGNLDLLKGLTESPKKAGGTTPPA